MRRPLLVFLFAVVTLGIALAPRHLVSRTAITGDWTLFESPHVRPLALTPNAQRLLAVNTADAHLTVFDLSGQSPARVAEIAVGLEPVAVHALADGEAWVVNHLGDDVSIVDLATFNVRATLRVGDEPADVVFAGSPVRAFVSVSGEDALKVFDPADPFAPPVVIALPVRAPRALAVSPDGATVYAAAFHAPNHTTVLSEAEVGGLLPPPDPPMNPALPAAPAVGLIVRQGADAEWRDEAGTSWSHRVPYQIPDADIAEVDVATLTVRRVIGEVGSALFALAANPVTGTLAVAAHEARNHVRFEPNLRGHAVDTRLALVPPGGDAQVVPLDPHVNYAVTPGPQAERDSAIGLPSGVAWAANGQRAYVTSLASDRLAVVDAAGTLRARVATVGGPTGVVVDATRGRLYVASRFRNQVQVISESTLDAMGSFALGFDPTPDAIVNGRRFFYGGARSGHGEHACATCHLNGDLDLLAWDLGDPLGQMEPVPPGMLAPNLVPFHPMKGPMTTQTLRGLNGTGRLHWRADRANLAAFNGAFASLLGNAAVLPDSEFQAFSDFTLALVHPPNPNPFLDGSLPHAPVGQPSAVRGEVLFTNATIDGTFRCVNCHSAPAGTNGQMSNRFEIQSAQDMKIPQLRNLYRKLGFRDSAGAVSKRGFGFEHNGEKATLDDFLRRTRFNFGSGQSAVNNRADMAAYLLAFPTGMPPAIGAQVTFRGANNSAPDDLARLDTLTALAEPAAGRCDVVARGRVAGVPRGWRYTGGQLWQSDLSSDPPRATSQVIALAAPGGEITFMGVPVGSGVRMGVDRDRDGFRDGDERAAGSDPGDPASTPAATAPGATAASAVLHAAAPNPFRGATSFALELPAAARVEAAVYDVLGRRVRTLDRGVLRAAGTHVLAWDGASDAGRVAGPGVYWLRVTANGVARQRMVVRLP